MAEPDVIEIGPLIIRRASHEVKILTDKDIQLTALEFGILYLLASHPNQVFSAEEIFEAVWNQESIVSAKTVMVHVSHLRDKIEDALSLVIIDKLPFTAPDEPLLKARIYRKYCKLG